MPHKHLAAKVISRHRSPYLTQRAGVDLASNCFLKLLQDVVDPEDCRTRVHHRSKKLRHPPCFGNDPSAASPSVFLYWGGGVDFLHRSKSSKEGRLGSDSTVYVALIGGSSRRGIGSSIPRGTLRPVLLIART
jgi:hypothetical protein